MSDALVEIRDVTKRFDGFTAVDGVSLDILAGEFLSLLGPSGCGKTTLLRILAGFEAPTQGSVRLDGADITHQPPNRRPFNLVFQHYALFPHLTVGQNVAFGLRYQRISGAAAAAAVDEALRRVRLEGLGARRPHQLSGGQRQRVALARALVLRPRVLLLDEPLGALDQKLRREMQVELKHLQRTLGITFVFVTHDQEEALTMSDRVAVMNAGRIEQIDAAPTVFERPRTEFVARFMGADNFFERNGVRFVVRPEKLRLIDPLVSAAGNPGLRVTVAERIYQGLSTIWIVAGPAGERWMVFAVNDASHSGRDGPRKGEPAVLSWDQRHEVTLARLHETQCPIESEPGKGPETVAEMVSP